MSRWRSATCTDRSPPDAPVELTLFRGDDEGRGIFPDDDFPGRWFSTWTDERLHDVIHGAGFTLDDLEVRRPGRGEQGFRVRMHARAARSPTSSAPGMRLLVSGLNPSVHAADAGVGYVTAGNRFWPAALAAGLVTRDRDPRHALRHHGIGMTDLVKRATPRADALTRDEYRAGVRAPRPAVRLAAARRRVLRRPGRLARRRRPAGHRRLAGATAGRAPRVRHAVDQRAERRHPAAGARRRTSDGRGHGHLTERSSTVPRMAVRLEPQDEYMHELGPEPNFNESMYFNLYDPAQGVGGWFRCGNRANEGYAEMTVCLYLPGGRVGFMFKRAEIADNDAFDAGGIRFDVLEPFKRLDVIVLGQGRRARRPAPDGRPEEGLHREPVRRVRGAHRVLGRVRHVRRRARRAAREARRGVRQGPLRAAHRRQGLDPRRRRGVGGRRLRPPRPLVGPALLAGPLVLPLAHRQLRARLRLHGLAGRPARRRRHPRRLRVGGRQAPPLPRLRDRHRVGGRGHATTRASPPRCAPATRSGRSPAR